MSANLTAQFHRERAAAIVSDRGTAAFLARWGSTDPMLAHPPTDEPAAEPEPAAPVADLAAERVPERVDRSRVRILPDAPAVILTRAADVRPEPIAWAWAGRVPLGSLTLLVGQPGLGKSTAALTLAAMATRGNLSGDLAAPVDVLYLSAEDSPAHTLVPRLIAAGADLARVHFLTLRDDAGERGLALPDDVDHLAEAVARTAARIVCVDPIMAHLATALDAHRDHAIRRALAPLASLADGAGVAILAVAHLNKSAGSDLFGRVGGSIGLTAAARSVLVMGTDPEAGEDAPDRIIAHGKSNVGPLAPALRVRIEGRTVDTPDGPIPTSGIAWTGEAPDVHVSDLLGSSEDGGRTDRTDAAAFLADVLGDGPLAAKDVRRMARDAGIADRTLDRAKASAGIVSHRSGFGPGATFAWALPDHRTPSDPIERHRSSVSNVASYGDGGDLCAADALADYPPSATDPDAEWLAAPLGDEP